MKLASSTLGCPDWTVEEVARRAAEYGFDAVELRVKGDRHVDPALTREERRRVKAMFDAAGVGICCLSGYSVFNGDTPDKLQDNVRLLESYLELAQELNVPYVRTFIGRVPAGLTQEQVIRRSAECLRASAERARACGVSILIETHDDFSSAAAVAEIVRQADSPQVAVLWDVLHTLAAGESPREVCEALGGLIRHVHLKDAVVTDQGEKRLCLAGAGDVPLRECVEALRAVGYTGYLSLEWEKTWHPALEEPEIALPQYIRYARDLLNNR